MVQFSCTKEKNRSMIRNFLEVRRPVISDIDRFFAISASKLGNVRNRNIVQCPKRVFIERFDAFLEANFNTVGQQVVLPQEVLLLNLRVERGIVFFSDGHRRLPTDEHARARIYRSFIC